MMPGQNLSQRQEQRQEQIMAPQQIQSLELLAAQSLELQAMISREIAENPVLEIEDASDTDEKSDAGASENTGEQDESEDDSQSEKSSDAPSSAEHPPDSPAASENLSSDSDIADIISWADSYSGIKTGDARGSDPDYDEKRQHFFDSISEEPSLQEQLLEQLRLSSSDTEKIRFAELVIGSIDEQGYLRTHPRDLATAAGISLEEMEKIIDFVQTFDPPGIGARNLKECLALQLNRMGKSKSRAAELVKHHFDDLSKNKLPQIAKKMRLSMTELNRIIAELRKLNPYPGFSLSPNNPIFVAPEAVVEKKNGTFIVTMNKDTVPRLRISQTYLRMLKNPDVSAETKTYIKEKILKAKNIMKSLAQRESTIKKIADVIVDSQFDFFDKGVENLHPLTMQKVADRIGAHETTVSRAISNKFIQTPHGLFEFKFFFSSGYQSKNGYEMSSRSIIEKIKDMILAEDSSNPLSDKKIAELLKSQGFNVARRTIAKYREGMEILSSHLRKEHL
jgi:RNA polymerase sigma-54 factor